MSKSVLGTKYVVIDNNDCFVQYTDAPKSKYTCVVSSTAMPHVRDRYDTKDEAEQHAAYLTDLKDREIARHIAYRKDHNIPDDKHTRNLMVIEDLKLRSFSVASLSVDICL